MEYESWQNSELALERKGIDPTAEGIDLITYRDPFPVTHLTIKTERSATEIGRPIGEYITISYPPLFAFGRGEEWDAIHCAKRRLEALLPKDGALLVVGLGNPRITADALGPSVVKELADGMGKRHLYLYTPDVREASGYEAAEGVAALASTLQPAAVIAIDALAARGKERLASTLQLTNTGIIPGSGICREKAGIIEEAVGCPVISIGVPTMMHTGVLIEEMLLREGARLSEGLLQSLQNRHDYILPDGIDLAIERASYLIASALLTL